MILFLDILHSNKDDFDVTPEMGEREAYLDDPSHHGTFLFQILLSCEDGRVSEQ